MKTQSRPARGGCSRWPAQLALLAGCFLAPTLSAQLYDFGDAPDPTLLSDTGYPVAPGQPAVTGKFPTLLISNGARHSIIGQEWLGALPPDAETDAKVVNLDKYDDAFPPIPFFLTLTSLPPQATVTFKVSVAATAPDVDRYVNMLIDWDQSGDWKNIPMAAPEWAINNFWIGAGTIPPGTSKWFTAPIQWGLGAQLAPQIFWVRMTLTRTAIDPGPFGADGWDGTGSFTYGETEDFLFHPNKKHSDPGVPPPGAVPGWPPPGFPPGDLPGIKLVPRSQDVPHGRPARVKAELVKGGPPDTLEWRVGPGQRGGFLFDPGTPYRPVDGSSYTAPSGSTATAVTGPPPALATITVTSTVHPLFPPMEEWMFAVKARWIGVRVQIRKAVVRIWHSGWGGVFGIFSHYKMLEEDIGSVTTDPPGAQDDLLGEVHEARRDWKLGFYATARDALNRLRGLVDAHVPDPDDRARLHEQIDDLDAAMPGNSDLAVPVPELDYPRDGDTVHGHVVCEASTESPTVGSARFEVTTDGATWHHIGTDTDGSDGWSVHWDTTDPVYPDGTARVRVTMTHQFFPTEGEHEAMVWIDNSVAEAIPEHPAPLSTVAGLVQVRAMATDPQDAATCTFSIAGPGGDWFDIGADGDPEDGYATLLDTGQLEPGPWTIRAMVVKEVDEAVIVRETMWPIEVAPSFLAWRMGLGLLPEGLPGYGAEDDLNQDGIPLGLEYYFGLNPFEPAAIADHVFWEQMAGPDFMLRFQPVPWTDGVRCRVETTEDLELWDTLLEVPTEGPVGEIAIPIPTLPRRFIRLNLSEDRP